MAIKNLHKEYVETLGSKIEETVHTKETRWDDVWVEEENPEEKLEINEPFNSDIDLALINEEEIWALEVKTARGYKQKAQDQLNHMRDYFESQGYDFTGNYLIKPMGDEFRDWYKLLEDLQNMTEGIFDHNELRNELEYSREWNSFHSLIDNNQIRIIDDPECFNLHEIFDPHKTDYLNDQGKLEPLGDGNYVLSDELKNTVRNNQNDVYLITKKGLNYLGEI